MSDDRTILGPIDIAGPTPARILAFDAERRPVPAPVDLDQPFFQITRPEHPECNHRDRGVRLDMGRRRAICLGCGEAIDTFDALLIYAHAQQRMQNTRDFIEADRRREQEKRDAKPFVRDVRGFAARFARSRRPGRHGRLLGYDVTLACGHDASWDKRKPPRRMTCHQCVRESKLKTGGVAVLAAAGKAPCPTSS